jgi:threonylcarbamoyladenosine tRNA methylthiotransferase MtaB
VLTGVHLGGYADEAGGRLSELIARILGETGIPSAPPRLAGTLGSRRCLLAALRGSAPDAASAPAASKRIGPRPATHGPALQNGRVRAPRRAGPRACARPQHHDRHHRRLPRRRRRRLATHPRLRRIDALRPHPCLQLLAAGRNPSGRDAEPDRSPHQASALERAKGPRTAHAHGGPARADRQVVEILCEGNPDGERREKRFGYTPNYLPVQVAAHETAIDGNQLVEVILSGLDDGGLALVGQPTDRRTDSRD